MLSSFLADTDPSTQVAWVAQNPLHVNAVTHTPTDLEDDGVLSHSQPASRPSLLRVPVRAARTSIMQYIPTRARRKGA
jgi:hypothetical protein